MNADMDSLNHLRVNKPNITTSLELANLLFFDIETTGLRPDRGAKITEVSIVNRYIQQYSWSADITNNISFSIKELDIILKHLQKGVVVGHNLPFDFWFISYEADKLAIEGPNLRFIDTLSLSRKLLPDKNSYRLGDLLREFNIEVSGELHTATTDAATTRALFWKLIEKGGISTVGEAGMKKLNWSSF